MKRGVNKKLVYIAMSGGVDSSVTAALLKRQGYNVIGVFMRPWQPVDKRLAKSFIHKDIRCMWQKDREDAMKVAAKLGIPLLTWDFSKEYKREVTDYMVREYKAGRTPNPDVMCNKHIKFGLFLEKALKEGADFIATGHYVIKHKAYNLKRNSRATRYTLHVSRDGNKDQSYFLWTLTQKQLKYCLFPIGDYTKPEVRQLAKKFGLPNHAKKDSQGVCFIGPLDMKRFLKNYIRPKNGQILDVNGLQVGSHDGVFYYTIGQRHGLHIGNGRGPYFVVKKDIKKNIIYVGKESHLRQRELKIFNMNLINSGLKFPARVSIKIRYRSISIPAIINSSGLVQFSQPIRAVTSGQSAVFYKGNELLGGGIII